MIPGLATWASTPYTPSRPRWRGRGGSGLVVAAWAMVAATGHLCAAQDSTGSIVGVVVAREGGAGLPFSTVAIDPPGRTIFTDSSGSFRIPGLAVGAYRVLVRELGYAPVDTTIEVQPGPATASAVFALAFVPHRLPTLPVRVARECRAPGMPDSSISPELATIADQLRTNAERLRLLLASVPFDYDVEAHLTSRPRPDSPIDSDEVDTLTFASWLDHPYRVGSVVDRRFVGLRRGGRYPGPYTYLPGLQDLADSAFQATHCFTYAGVDTSGGQSMVRIDFAPLRAIRSPDVGGSVFLDVERFIVRRALFHLTHPERVDPPLRSLRAETRYRELVPLVAVEDSVRAVRTWGSVVTGGEGTGWEEDHVIAVRFSAPRAR
jgi:carboxypeptidase family protein